MFIFCGARNCQLLKAWAQAKKSCRFSGLHFFPLERESGKCSLHEIWRLLSHDDCLLEIAPACIVSGTSGTFNDDIIRKSAVR